MEFGRALPTWMPPLTFVHCEPGPVTVTSPLPSWPRTPPVKVKSVPPFWMVRLPTPIWPTTRVCATAPGVSTTVAFGNVTLMFAFVPPSTGTPAVQLPGLNQSEDIAPVQLVWARRYCGRGKQRQHRSGCQQMCAHFPPPPGCRFSLRRHDSVTFARSASNTFWTVLSRLCCGCGFVASLK